MQQLHCDEIHENRENTERHPSDDFHEFWEKIETYTREQCDLTGDFTPWDRDELWGQPVTVWIDLYRSKNQASRAYLLSIKIDADVRDVVGTQRYINRQTEEYKYGSRKAQVAWKEFSVESTQLFFLID